MAIRAGMAYLIERVQQLANVVDTCNYFGEQRVQDALDRYRTEERYETLEAIGRTLQGGSIEYKIFQATHGDWEGTAAGSAPVIVDGGYGTIAWASADNLTGRWTCGTQPIRPAMIVGFRYDVYAAAALLCEERASQLTENYDFAMAGRTLNRSQAYKMLMDRASHLWSQSGHSSATAVRSDVW